MPVDTKVKVENINGVGGCFALPYYCELGVTNKIITLSIENFRTINTDVEDEIRTFERKKQY